MASKELPLNYMQASFVRYMHYVWLETNLTNFLRVNTWRSCRHISLLITIIYTNTLKLRQQTEELFSKLERQHYCYKRLVGLMLHISQTKVEHFLPTIGWDTSVHTVGQFRQWGWTVRY